MIRDCRVQHRWRRAGVSKIASRAARARRRTASTAVSSTSSDNELGPQHPRLCRVVAPRSRAFIHGARRAGATTPMFHARNTGISHAWGHFHLRGRCRTRRSSPRSRQLGSCFITARADRRRSRPQPTNLQDHGCEARWVPGARRRRLRARDPGGLSLGPPCVRGF